MKKVTLPIIVVFLLIIVVFSRLSLHPANDKKEETFAEEVSTLQGYYFHGYLDIREPLESFDETTTYMYHMNNYLKEYLDQSSAMRGNEQKEDYIHYFDQLDEPIYPISFHNKYDLNNGDYVKVTFKGGIKESYPAQIGEVLDVEVINLTD